MTMFQVSQIVYVYNQRRYVDEVVAAAFAQDYDGEMEILLSDDGSTDGSYERLLELASSYTGRHHVRVRRTPENRGAAYHLDQAVRESQGELIVGIAGDDIPLPHRVSTMVEHWERLGGGTVLMYSSFEKIDVDGNAVESNDSAYIGNHDLADMAAGQIGILGASCAFTRDIIELFPGFVPNLLNEDRVTPWRTLLLGGKIDYINLKTIRYRIHGGVSRYFPINLTDYLKNWLPKKHGACIADANQRLIDLRYLDIKDCSLNRSCTETIFMHTAIVDLCRSSWMFYEIHLVKGLFRANNRRFIISNYIKLRARWLLESLLGPKIRATVKSLN